MAAQSGQGSDRCHVTNGFWDVGIEIEGPEQQRMRDFLAPPPSRALMCIDGDRQHAAPRIP
jgi:hypothetical protein